MQNNKSIIETLLYFEIFSFAPTLDELHTFLLHEKISKSVLKKKLAHNEFVDSIKDFYFLKGKRDVFDQRQIRHIISQEKKILAQKQIQQLSKIPTIRSIALSGSVACDNAHEDDDIDLFIITSPGSVWMTRFLVYAFLKIAGKIRGKRNKNNLFCPNMFVSMADLEISEKNVYTASEIGHLSLIYDKNKSFDEFLNANKWITEYFPNLTTPKSQMRENTRTNKLVQKLDRIMFYSQILLMRKKITNEKIYFDRIQFHPNNLSFLILKLWESRKYAYYKSLYFRKIVPQLNNSEIRDHTPGS